MARRPERLTDSDDSVRLRGQLERLKWRNADLARHIGVCPDTVSRWIRKRIRVPGAVWAYLDIVEGLLKLNPRGRKK